MFNLNDKNFDGGNAVFNGGIAGKVNNVKFTVEKKKTTDPDNSPDYKIFYKDDQEAVINQGFYYHANNPSKDDKKNKDLEMYLVSRVLSIAKTVLGKDYVFEEYQTSKDALDGMFKLINANSEGKLVSIFTTYGTTTKPSQYLGLRYFNFIETMDSSPSRLVRNNNDQMERIVADAVQSNSTEASNTWK